MKTNILILFLILIVGFQSCSDSSNPVIPINSNFTYPLKIDNKWDYSISFTYSNVKPDSIKYLLSDLFLNIHLTVTKDTILQSNPVFEMKEENDDYSDSYGFYSNTAEGFYKYAYSPNGSYGLPKAGNRHRFIYRGTYFNSITELIRTLEESIPYFKSPNDSLIFFNPPRLIFKYPFEVGKEWVFSSESVFINKEIVGKENIKTELGYFDCFKIKWKLDFDMDGNWDDDIVLYEYLSSKGILKYVYTIKDIIISSVTNPDSIGTADINYERILTGTNF